jgi:cyanophycin synthetase
MSQPQLNASSRIMFNEAQQRKIECTAFADNETILMQYQGKSWYVRGSRTSFQSSVGKTIADYKPLTKQVLSHFQLPTGKWVMITSEEGVTDQVRTLLTGLPYPVVMKPLNERHGKDVVVGLETVDDVIQHYRAGTSVLIEEQLSGEEYRVVCVDYQFVAAAYRKPAYVVGDGVHSITELVAEKNKHPWRGEGHQNNLTKIVVDASVEEFMKEQGFTATDIPPAGQEVLLRKTANLSTGGEAWNISDQVHPQNKQLFEEIARRCDLNVIGIDVMCQDITQPIVHQSKAGIIEVNASPGLRMHHFPIQGEAVNVARLILDLCLREAQRR